MRFLDNVLQDYIDRAPDEMARARYSAERERSVGLGVMGFHSFLQQKGLGFESAMAKAMNLKMFKHIQAKASEASMLLAQERGPCPDAAEMGAMERFSCKMAIAPTASISDHLRRDFAPVSSRSLRTSIPIKRSRAPSSSRTHILEKLLDKKSQRTRPMCGTRSLRRGGSVQHLDFLSEEEKASFKTSFEIDQRWLLEFAADRAPFVDQAQSLNLFIPADVDKWDLMMLHFQAWEKGIKSLYYLRSKSVQRAGFAGGVEADNTADAPEIELKAELGEQQTDYEECLSCQ